MAFLSQPKIEKKIDELGLKKIIREKILKKLVMPK